MTQIASLAPLVRIALFIVSGALAGRELRVLGHNEVSSKGCPAFDVQAWLRARPAISKQAARRKGAGGRKCVLAIPNALFKRRR